MPVDVDTVAATLRESLAAHQQARDARHRKDLATAREQLQRAYDLRVQAHEADPQHDAPIWREEQQHTPTGRDTHADLMAFYQQQLGLAPNPPPVVRGESRHATGATTATAHADRATGIPETALVAEPVVAEQPAQSTAAAPVTAHAEAELGARRRPVSHQKRRALPRRKSTS